MKKYSLSAILLLYICILHIQFLPYVSAQTVYTPESAIEKLQDLYLDQVFEDPNCKAASVAIKTDAEGNKSVLHIMAGDCVLDAEEEDTTYVDEVTEIGPDPEDVIKEEEEIVIVPNDDKKRPNPPIKDVIDTSKPNIENKDSPEVVADIIKDNVDDSDSSVSDGRQVTEGDELYQETGSDISVIAAKLAARNEMHDVAGHGTTLVMTELDDRDVAAGVAFDDQKMYVEVLDSTVLDIVLEEVSLFPGVTIFQLLPDLAPEYLELEIDTSVTSVDEVVSKLDNNYLGQVYSYRNLFFGAQNYAGQSDAFTNQSVDSNIEDDEDQRYLDYVGLGSDSCGIGPKSVSVAIVDNAFESQHDDLSAAVTSKFDVGDKDTDVNPVDPSDKVYNHGTVQAGIIGGIDNDFGITGIAAGVDLMVIKASRDSAAGGTITDGITGVAKAYQEGAQVINISWGAFSESAMLEKVTKKIAKAGVIIVAAAGNYNSSDKFYPAAYEGVIGVAAIDQEGKKARFSNYGPWVDIAAPGVSMYTTDLNNSFGSYSGTSEASPAVAAGIALALSYGMDREDIQKHLVMTDQTGIGDGILNLSFVCEEAKKLAINGTNKTHGTANVSETNRGLIGGGLLILLGILGSLFARLVKRKED